MADFYVKLPRNLDEQEAEKLQDAGIAYSEGGYPDSGEPRQAGSTIHVRFASDEHEARRRVVELLGLDEQEAASLDVRLAAESE